MKFENSLKVKLRIKMLSFFINIFLIIFFINAMCFINYLVDGGHTVLGKISM